MKIICIGDSNTLGYDPRSFFGEQYPQTCIWTSLLAAKLDAAVVNEGENGRTVGDIAYIKTGEYDYLILMLGTNDILENRSALETRQKLEEVLAKYPLYPEKTILIAPPMLKPGAWISDPYQIKQSQMLGQEYCELSAKMGTFFVNAVSWDISLCYDGVHFSEAGHSQFAKYLAEYFYNFLCQL